jgi:hypothetical protein
MTAKTNMSFRNKQPHHLRAVQRNLDTGYPGDRAWLTKNLPLPPVSSLTSSVGRGGGDNLYVSAGIRLDKDNP